MNEILVIHDDTSPQYPINGRELHEQLGVETPYHIWFPRMCEYGFAAGCDYEEVSNKNVQNPQGGRPSKHHMLTLSMAKEICMIQRSDVGRQIRRYLIEVENAWNSPEQIMCVLIPKTDKATKAKIDEAIREVYDENKSTKFKGLLFEEIQTPLHDGDGRKPKGGAYGEECKGHWVLNASSKNKPGVVDGDRKPVTDATKIWAGEYGRVAINFYAYEVSGNKGVACGLNGVQCLGYGDPIDGRISAEDAFNDGFEDEMDDEL